MMKNRLSRALLAVALGVAAATSACIQMPTEKQGVADLRPQLSFRLAAPELGAARVQVDGLPMGEVGQYVEGVAALRLLPGTHRVEVVVGERTLLDERFYIGDGVHKTFVIK